MAISVLTRPEKTLSNGYLSKWNSSELPLRYKFESDLYPINKIDASQTITNLVYNSSKQGTVVTLLSNPYTTLEFVTISGTGIDSLDGGNFQIKEVDGNDIVLDVFTNETSNVGSVVLFYRNYLGLIKVFAGSREGHPYNTDGSKPLQEIGVLEVDFTDDGVDNFGFVNVKSFVKPDITADFDYNYENSHFGWTSFHLQLSESYDIVSGGSVVNFQSDFIDDEQQDCEPFVGFEDPSFDNGLTDWNQEAFGTSNTVWVAGVGNVTAFKELELVAQTQILNQDLKIYDGVTYTFNFNVFVNSLGASSFAFRFYGWDGVNWNQIGLTDSNYVLGNNNKTLNVTPMNTYSKVGFDVFGYGSAPKIDIRLDDIQISTNVAQPCLYFNYAVFGCKQFQDDLGGNFGDYVLNIEDTITPKILTHFNELSYFYDKPFYVNGIIPSSTFSLSEDSDNLFVFVELYDSSNNNILSFQDKVDNKGDGVYTVEPTIKENLEANKINNCDWSYGVVKFIIIPTNTFVDADNGTFESGVVNGITILPYSAGTPNQVGNGINIAPNNYARTGLYSGQVSTSAPSMNESLKVYDVFENDTTINVIEGRTYEIRCYIAVRDFDFEPSQKNNASFYFLPQGYDKSEATISPYEITDSTIYPNTEDPTFDDWYPSVTSFVAKTTESLKLTFHHELKEDINIGTGVFLFIDDITFKGPFEFISESKNIKNQCDCNFFGVTLRWLNDLGGWESWYFNKKAIYSENVNNKINIKRDITTDWDNTFINGDTQNDTIKTTSNKSILVRSQLLTKNEQEVLQQIRRSVRVQLLMDSGKWQTVTINQGRFVIDNEDDKTREISFEINLPDTIIQEQ